MWSEILLVVIAGLGLIALALLVALVRRRPGGDAVLVQSRLESFEKAQERAERSLRDEFGSSRGESADQARGLREELSTSLKGVGDSLLSRLGGLTETHSTQSKALRDEVNVSIQNMRTDVTAALQALAQAMADKQDALRLAVEERLAKIQEDNGKRLDEMRKTVDEKLEGTLEKRLGESFKQVSDRLEQVHRGLGEMQTLASGVGDLKKVLTNVKTRGGWGEIQLGNLLDQILTADQYGKNVATRPGSNERVEFAIKLPGRSLALDDTVWLPIDSKFPLEDYQRLVEAADRADKEGVEEAAARLEAAVKACARDIREKYLAPPHTTDFALLFLPAEGLYAEVLRRPGLAEKLQREHRVVLTGPTTLAALLNSLQMGFRTLAIEQRSSEVWKVLGAVKSEFQKFAAILDGVHKKLQTASNTIEEAARKSRTIERKLKEVEALPAADTPALLPDGDDEVDSTMPDA